MYLFLGHNTVIDAADIVGIFDLENTSISKITKGFLRQAQQGGLVREVSEELPKSFVVCQKKGKTTVYLAQVSPVTLRRRLFFLQDAGREDVLFL